MSLIKKIIFFGLIFGLSACGPNKNKEVKTEPRCQGKGQDLVDCLRFQIKNNRLPNDKMETLRPLSYCDFKRLKDDKIMAEKDSNDLIDYAYQNGNPILFKKAFKEILPEFYSLNFLWIHKNKLHEEGHFFGKDDEKLENNLLNPLMDWQEKQPEANINFWYDGSAIEEDNLAKTKKAVIAKNLNMDKITFRNIRDIPLVNENARLYEENIPIYFRVDLSKAIIGDFVLSEDKIPFVVNIDSDVVAITREQLFDDLTLNALNNIGYAFGATGRGEENSFIILHNLNSLPLLNRHRRSLIETSIKMANRKLDEGDKIYFEDVFGRYLFFRSSLNSEYEKKYGRGWSPVFKGKPMIFPKSQSGGSPTVIGYSDLEIKIFKSALLGLSGCK